VGPRPRHACGRDRGVLRSGVARAAASLIFDYLRERDPWRFAAAHRRRFADHPDVRESDATGQIIGYFRRTDDLEAAAGSSDEAVVVGAPEVSCYELRLDGRLIGLTAY
jgi:hypothetical protein